MPLIWSCLPHNNNGFEIMASNPCFFSSTVSHSQNYKSSQINIIGHHSHPQERAFPRCVLKWYYYWPWKCKYWKIRNAFNSKKKTSTEHCCVCHTCASHDILSHGMINISISIPMLRYRKPQRKRCSCWKLIPVPSWICCHCYYHYKCFLLPNTSLHRQILMYSPTLVDSPAILQYLAIYSYKMFRYCQTLIFQLCNL